MLALSTIRDRILTTAVVLSVSVVALSATQAQTSLTKQLNAATKDAANGKYELRYKFEKGEKLRWRAAHEATTLTRINKVENFDRALTKTTKVWLIKEVKSDGSIVLEQSIEDLELSQSIAGDDEIRFDSKSDEDPPIQFEAIADSVGVPLVLVTISDRGETLDKEAIYIESQMGMDDVAVPLPEEAVEIGASWYSPSEMVATTEAGQPLRVKLRKSYTLESVKNDIATISMKTEVLTPVKQPRILSQLIQEMAGGEIKFNIATGRLVSKKFEWDEEVVGFSTAQSYMEFHATFSEEWLDDTAQAVTAEGVRSILLRDRDDPPTLRK